MSTKHFNLRVYGICINQEHEILLSQELYNGLSFTKFPGGGLEWGEGMIDCLKREFQEEFGLDITVGELFYLTDFFQQSAFSEKDQVISVYYEIQLPIADISFNGNGDKSETLKWHPLAELTPDIFMFPIDKHIATLLNQYT